MKSKQRIAAIIALLITLFSSCALPTQEGAETRENTGNVVASETESEMTARDFSLPEIIELEPGESLTLDLPAEAVVESGDEGVVSVTPSGLMAGERGETTLSVTLDGVKKQAIVTVVRFEEADEEETGTLAKGKYLLVVNKNRNYVVVYDVHDEARSNPLKAMICSTGTATPDKTYKLGSRKVWNRLYGNVWGKYATVIHGDILFHSVPYARKDSSTLIGAYYNQLGTTASMGCVRLRVCDAKWIYDCCEPGTIVSFVTDDVDSPIAYEQPILMPDALTWDPTDLEEGNPWLEKKPWIEADNHAIAAGSDFSLEDYVKVYDLAGNDVTAQATVKGTVNTAHTGRYLLCISYEDTLHNRVSKTIHITVAESH